MKRTANLILIIILIFFISSALYSKKDKSDHLPGKYKKWLERDVIYIITPLEKEVFLKLKSDRERDYFIEAFWKQRDPNANTPENEFRTEHYRRIKYANRYFGKEAPGPGWKSDMGRIYIILGEPDHKSKYLNETGIRPLQIWNYSGKMAYGLPNTFNVVFFQRDGTGEFKLYSPLKFGPASLLENYMGDPRDHLAAYSQLFEIEPTVASISLSLLPHEEQVTSPSLASESLIAAKIPAAPHNKINDAYADKILDYKGFVKVEYMIDYIENKAMVKVLKQKPGIYYVHYLIEPKRLTLEQYDDFLYSNLELVGKITDLEDNPVYYFTKKVPVKLKHRQLKNIKTRNFSFQDIFPLVSGKYKYYFLMMNKINREFTTVEGKLEIPGDNELQMSSIVLAGNVQEQSKHIGKLKAFLFKDIQMAPSPDNSFEIGKTLFIYFQINRIPGEHKREGHIEYRIIKERDNQRVDSWVRKCGDYHTDLEFFEKKSLKGLPYANYLLSIALIDGKGVKVLEKETHFHISPLPLSPAWVLSLATAPGSNAHQYNIIGTQYLEKNEPHKAVNYLEKAYHQKPFSEKFAIDLCYALLKLEKRKRIKEILTPFFKGIQKVKTSKMYLMMGDNAKAMKNYPAAIHYYQEYLSHFGLNVNVLNALGESYYRTGNLEEARRIFQRSIRENPGQEKVRNFLLKLKDEKFDNNKNEEKGR